jgi:uncharacterized protein (TIGR03503 family)
MLSWFWAVFFCVIFAIAVKADDVPPQKSVVEKIMPIGNEYQNSITLLNNRFRIDHDVEEVTLVFFRQFGAQPIVLVRPDGRKLYLDNDSIDDSYRWFESETYDMIELSKPIPGPWQALGEILPGSRVMVIADLTLQADPIPNPVFSGETIKQTAVLRNADQEVNYREFKDIVVLSIDFMSTNIPEYANFGLGTKNISRFKDNGLGLDEVPGDGIFTGQFNLQVAYGEWQPVFNIRTPLFSRELMTDKVLLLPPPVTLTHEEDDTEEGFHRILIEADPEYLETSTLMLEASLRGPEGNVERISITGVGDYQRQLRLANVGYGDYSADIKVFAKTTSGREIVLTLPKYNFSTEPPIIQEPVRELTESEILAAQKEAEAKAIAEAQAAKEKKANDLLKLVLAINGAVLLIGGIVILLIYDRRRRPDRHVLSKLKPILSKLKFKKKQALEEPSAGNA